MGAASSCFRVNDPEEQQNQCLCLNLLTARIILACTQLFQRQEVHPIPPPAQGSAAAQHVIDDSSCDTYHAPPRPLPYDDPRCSPLHHSGYFSRLEKTLGECHGETEPIRSYDRCNTMSFSTNDKVKESECQDLKQSSEVIESKINYILPLLEDDDDICPICLEEYTQDNPKNLLQCLHHFHLCCIYEWMERSEACPVCGKVMLFSESR